MVNTTNPNHDKIWAIVRDAQNGAISINDAVARIKGLQDATELTEESYEMADNVNPDKAKNSDETNKLQEQSVQNELAFGNTADPGEGADADINDIIGNDTSRDTNSLGVVSEDEVGTGKLEGDMVVATEEKDVDPDLKTTPDGAKAKPANESNEVAPAVGGNTAREKEPKATESEANDEVKQTNSKRKRNEK